MMSFRIFNMDVEVGFGFFAVPALILCIDGGEGFIAAMLACAVHEAGHALASRICRIRISGISLGAFGIHMYANFGAVSYLRRAFISLAGPLMNLVFFVLLLPLDRSCAAVELILFTFHMLPAVPLDGGAALYSALCAGLLKEYAERIIVVLSVLLALGLGWIGFSVLLETRGNFSLLLMAVYIMLYIALKTRDELC